MRSDLIATLQRGGPRVIVGGGAALVILIALIFIGSTLLPHSPRTNHAPFIGVGQAMARATAKLVQEQGQIAVILSDDYQADDIPVHDEWQAFCAELKKHPGVHLLGTEIVDLPTLVEFGLTRIQAADILKKYPTINVLVSFCGIPPWNQAELSALPRPAPKIVAVAGRDVPIKEYLASGIAAVVIAPRIPLRTTATQPRSPAEWFDRSFQVYTTENYQSLPELTE